MRLLLKKSHWYCSIRKIRNSKWKKYWIL